MADGLFLRNIQDLKELRMDGGLSPADLYYIGLPFIGHDNIEHALYLFQRSVTAVMRGRHRVTGRAGKIATVCYLYYAQTAVLLMILAKAAIKRATVVGVGIVAERRFGRFIIITGILVVGDVCSDQYFFAAVLRAVFEHEHLALLEDDLGVHPA
jgi:hypothetical protein